MKKYIIFLIACSIILIGLWSFTERESHLEEKNPLFITGITTFGHHLLMTEKGRCEVALYSADGKERLKAWKTNEPPTGVVTDGKWLYITTSQNCGGVEFINTQTDEIYFIETGRGACAPVLNAQQTLLYVCNKYATTVTEIELKTRKIVRTVKVLRQPNQAVIDQDGRYLFVINHLPMGRANVDKVAAAVSVIDLKTFQRINDIMLENGSNALRGATISPDGKYLLITHNLGRYQVPTSQLQQGWMNTNALSLIQISTLTYGGAVLLDEPDRGAAGVWDVKCTPTHLVTTHSGTHEISIINYREFIDKYERTTDKSTLCYDLRFLVGLRQRISLKGNGPRECLIKDEVAIVPTYFSDTLNFVPLTNPKQQTATPLVINRQETRAERGERYFNDASFCFQNWQSCNGCHPDEARTDGLNWDLLNDGIGNPKNCKSMLFAHVTPPSMISGIRDDAKVSVRAGFKYIQFHEVSEDIASCVDDYLMQLSPVPSPYLINGSYSPKAEAGKKIFEKLNCDFCHSGPYFTDQHHHVIGTDVEFKDGWDTPTLREVWRTAPYLFDGRATTLEEVFKIYKHGLKRQKLTPKELEDLVEYIQSL